MGAVEAPRRSAPTTAARHRDGHQSWPRCVLGDHHLVATQNHVDVPQVRTVTQEAAQQLLWVALDPDPMVDPSAILADAHALREAIAAAELAGRLSDNAAFGGQVRPTPGARPSVLSRTQIAQNALDALGGLIQARLETAMLTRRFTSGLTSSPPSQKGIPSA